MSMKMVHHGGKCCGIKIIYNMELEPGSMHSPLPKETGACVDGSMTCIGRRWGALDARPEETGQVRLDYFIGVYEEARKTGILEIVLQTPTKPSYSGHVGQAKWIPALEARGFKEVNAYVNSNSTNTIHVFHKNIGEKIKAKKEPKNEQSDQVDAAVSLPEAPVSGTWKSPWDGY